MEIRISQSSKCSHVINSVLVWDGGVLVCWVEVWEAGGNSGSELTNYVPIT